MNKIVYINTIILIAMTLFVVSYLIYKAYLFDQLRKPVIRTSPSVNTRLPDEL